MFSALIFMAGVAYTLFGFLVLFSLDDSKKYHMAMDRVMGKGAAVVLFCLVAWPWVALLVLTLNKRLLRG